MSKTVTNAQIMELLNDINAKLDSFESRLVAIENSATTKKPAASSKPVQSELSKFEPRKDTDGFYIWNSYKTKMVAFCYAEQGVTYNQVNHSNNAKELGIEVDFKEKWAESKEKFKAQFRYIKKSDR